MQQVTQLIFPHQLLKEKDKKALAKVRACPLTRFFKILNQNKKVA